MYFPKREEKTFTLPKYKEKSIDNENIVIEENKTEQENLKAKYKVDIDKKLKPALENITISQINRFYSILEGRNFSFQSKEIEKFVEEQIKRNEENKGTKEFYEFFKKNFLENSEFQSENKKNRVIFEMIKRYVRYSIGAKNLKEEKLDGEKGEN